MAKLSYDTHNKMWRATTHDEKFWTEGADVASALAALSVKQENAAHESVDRRSRLANMGPQDKRKAALALGFKALSSSPGAAWDPPQDMEEYERQQATEKALSGSPLSVTRPAEEPDKLWQAATPGYEVCWHGNEGTLCKQCRDVEADLAAESAAGEPLPAPQEIVHSALRTSAWTATWLTRCRSSEPNITLTTVLDKVTCVNCLHKVSR